jgi:hypothetical protein
MPGLFFAFLTGINRGGERRRTLISGSKKQERFTGQRQILLS